MYKIKITLGNRKCNDIGFDNIFRDTKRKDI